MKRLKNKRLVVILTVLLSLPTIFFLFFMFGEVLSGDLNGFGHLLQAAPFLILILVIFLKR